MIPLIRWKIRGEQWFDSFLCENISWFEWIDLFMIKSIGKKDKFHKGTNKGVVDRVIFLKEGALCDTCAWFTFLTYDGTVWAESYVNYVVELFTFLT